MSPNIQANNTRCNYGYDAMLLRANDVHDLLGKEVFAFSFILIHGYEKILATLCTTTSLYAAPLLALSLMAEPTIRQRLLGAK